MADSNEHGATGEAVATILEFAKKWAEGKRRDREEFNRAAPLVRALLEVTASVTTAGGDDVSEHSTATKDDAERLWKLLGAPAWKLQGIADAIQAAEERGRRAGVGEATGALTEARDALEQIWAAIGDRLCGKGPLAKEYAQAVASKADAAAKRIRAFAPRDSGKGNT